MVVTREYVDIPVDGRAMRTFVAAPRAAGPHPGVVFYTDIFQLTESSLRWAVRLGFDGLAVTHPFKNAMMNHVDEASPEAQALGATNLVVIRDGRSVGHNTDWVGFAERDR